MFFRFTFSSYLSFAIKKHLTIVESLKYNLQLMSSIFELEVQYSVGWKVFLQKYFRVEFQALPSCEVRASHWDIAKESQKGTPKASTEGFSDLWVN